MLPIVVIGESHADPFINRCICDQDTGEPLAITQTIHVPALTTTDFLDGEGRLHAKVAVALAALRFLVYAETNHPDVVPPSVIAKNLYSPEWSTGWRVNVGWRGVPVLFVVGELNARAVIASIPPYADVEVPFAANLALVPQFEPQAVVSAASIMEVITAQLAPLFGALNLLRSLGIGPLALHSLTPPTVNDAVYFAETGRDTRALTRSKVIVLFNHVMKEACERDGVIFLDRWDELTESGAVRDGYLRDAVHLHNEHMRPSLLHLYRILMPGQRRLVA